MGTTIQVASDTSNNISFFDEHLDAIITVFITIIGFFVTYIMTNRNFKDEIKKSKITLASEQIQTLPYDICQLMDAMIKGAQDDVIKQYSSILSKVLAYGSNQAVRIAIKMQRMSYETTDASSLDDRFPMLAAYSLLITQLKYDLTSGIISPESYFQLRLKDYNISQPKLRKAINDLIKELNLNNEFKV